MHTRLDRPELLARLRESTPAIAPSLLLCDFANLEQEVRNLEQTEVPTLHFDVMDGDFAPNFTYGMPIVQSLRDRTELIFETHLMISQPERYVEHFYQAGADVITIHVEAVDDPRPLLEKISNMGAVAGLAIDTPTPVERIIDAIQFCDLVLTMSVKIGFGGQAFDEVAIQKLETLAANTSTDVLLEVDGGINKGTVARVVEAGAELLVAGSAIFRSEDYSESVAELTSLARQAQSKSTMK